MNRGRCLVLAILFIASACSRQSGRELQDSNVRFRDAAAETGLAFRHENGSSGEYYLPEIMGSGVALLDYDNDGDLDVFLVQSGKLNGVGSKGSFRGHRLFRNELRPSAGLKFTDVSEAAGVSGTNYGMGVATGDYDGDGFVDLFVTGYGRIILYHNNGNGTFSDLTEAAGLVDPLWSTSATFLDYDHDGRLDLFVLHYVDFAPSNNKICQSATGERDYCTPKAYHGLPARLYRNVDGHRFRDVSTVTGISSAYGPGLGVAVADYNGDGWPDLYVANDTARNLLWVNQKNGTFREIGLESGSAYAEDGIPRAGMGVAPGDFDGDGTLDILVTNLMREGVTLFRNNGRAEFEDWTARFGLTTATVPFTGFGVGSFDADNDGDLDLLIANGAVTIMESQRGKPHPYEQTNQFLLNDGKRFRDVSQQAGMVFREPAIGRGAAFGDLDNDGDIDVVVTNNNGSVKLLLNDSLGRHWITIKAQPDASQSLSFGAKVSILLKDQRKFGVDVHTGGGYLSANDPRVHFGLGNSAEDLRVMITWADGTKEQWDRVPADRISTLKQGTGTHLP